MGEHGDKNGKRWVRVEGANRGAGEDGMGGKRKHGGTVEIPERFFWVWERDTFWSHKPAEATRLPL